MRSQMSCSGWWDAWTKGNILCLFGLWIMKILKHLETVYCAHSPLWMALVLWEGTWWQCPRLWYDPGNNDSLGCMSELGASRNRLVQATWMHSTPLCICCKMTTPGNIAHFQANYLTVGILAADTQDNSYSRPGKWMKPGAYFSCYPQRFGSICPRKQTAPRAILGDHRLNLTKSCTLKPVNRAADEMRFLVVLHHHLSAHILATGSLVAVWCMGAAGMLCCFGRGSFDQSEHATRWATSICVYIDTVCVYLLYIYITRQYIFGSPS